MKKRRNRGALIWHGPLCTHEEPIVVYILDVEFTCGIDEEREILIQAIENFLRRKS